jgi:hypothetical protein
MSDLRQQLQEYIDEKRASQSAIGKAIDYSGSVVSQFLDGTYKGDLSAVEKAISGFLLRERERKAAPEEKIPFIKTSIYQQAYDVIRSSDLVGEIGVIFGDAGLGKTEALNHYARRNTNVILIEAHVGYTARVLMRNLHKFSGGDGIGNITDLVDDICKRLKNATRCIIIDEAEHLNLRCLELLRHIHDRTDCGMVLAGMPKLMANLRGKNDKLKQLYSRLGDAVHLDKLTAEDTEKIVRAAVPNANGVWKAFHEQCSGNTRILAKFIRRAKRIAARNNSAVTEVIVNKIARHHKEVLGLA